MMLQQDCAGVKRSTLSAEASTPDALQSQDWQRVPPNPVPMSPSTPVYGAVQGAVYT